MRYWTTADGRSIRYDRLTPEHLCNILNQAASRFHTGEPEVSQEARQHEYHLLCLEAMKRGLKWRKYAGHKLKDGELIVELINDRQKAFFVGEIPPGEYMGVRVEQATLKKGRLNLKFDFSEARVREPQKEEPKNNREGAVFLASGEHVGYIKRWEGKFYFKLLDEEAKPPSKPLREYSKPLFQTEIGERFQLEKLSGSIYKRVTYMGQLYGGYPLRRIFYVIRESDNNVEGFAPGTTVFPV